VADFNVHVPSPFPVDVTQLHDVHPVTKVQELAKDLKRNVRDFLRKFPFRVFYPLFHSDLCSASVSTFSLSAFPLFHFSAFPLFRSSLF
jgi:hypothetical protein